MHSRQVVLAALGVLSCCLLTLGQTRTGQVPNFDPNKDVKTGVVIGQPIPSFRLLDQFGKWQDFNSVKGLRGAVLIFFRSADW